MKEWLINIRPPKYLRYLFFIGYCWYRSFRSERDEAHNSAMILLGTFHGILLLSIVFMLIPEQIFTNNKYYTLIPVIILVFLLFYYLFSYQNKWQNFVAEFKHIKRKQQRIGLIYLVFLQFWCFLFG